MTESTTRIDGPCPSETFIAVGDKMVRLPERLVRCPARGLPLHLRTIVPDLIRVVDAMRPKCILEWGPGFSSVVALARGIDLWSIEGTRHWYNQCVPLGLPHLMYVPDSSDEYVRVIRPDADLFVVDGRRRCECLDAIRALGGDRVVFLHDADDYNTLEALYAFRCVIHISEHSALASNSDHVLGIC